MRGGGTIQVAATERLSALPYGSPSQPRGAPSAPGPLTHRPRSATWRHIAGPEAAGLSCGARKHAASTDPAATRCPHRASLRPGVGPDLVPHRPAPALPAARECSRGGSTGSPPRERKTAASSARTPRCSHARHGPLPRYTSATSRRARRAPARPQACARYVTDELPQSVACNRPGTWRPARDGPDCTGTRSPSAGGRRSTPSCPRWSSGRGGWLGRIPFTHAGTIRVR